MTVSTLEAIFEGKRELFKGLAIESKPYDWKTYPIFHLDFGRCAKNTAFDLDNWLSKRVIECGQKYGITLSKDMGTSEELFDALLTQLGSKGERVVILIDEYDKVLSDNIYSETIQELLRILGNFYEVIKTQYKNIHFTFITGVTKYSKLSVFSKMNNLSDYTMTKDYACMCGYTQAEVEHFFSQYIDKGVQKTGLDRDKYLKKLKDQYDGYKFYYESESVYNPVSIGCFFADGCSDFKDYWIDSDSVFCSVDTGNIIAFITSMNIDTYKSKFVVTISIAVSLLVLFCLSKLIIEC